MNLKKTVKYAMTFGAAGAMAFALNAWGGNAVAPVYSVQAGELTDQEEVMMIASSPEKYDENFSGMFYNSESDQWEYIKEGVVQTDYTGIAVNEYGYWYFVNGQIDFHYTGMAIIMIDENESELLYFEDGSWRPDVTGLKLVTVKAEDEEDTRWMYVKDGIIDPFYTGMALNEYGWWYLKNGLVQFDYTGLAVNEYGYWYFDNGQIDFHYTGMAIIMIDENESELLYFEDGSWRPDVTGLKLVTVKAEDEEDTRWMYVKDGIIDPFYTGMALNEYGWWYLKNGLVQFDYTGVAANEYGCWYFDNGQIDFHYTGMGILMLDEDESELLYFEDGIWRPDVTGLKLVTVKTEDEEETLWMYVKNGMIDPVYEGMVENEYGWWYMKYGQIQEDYTGAAVNEYGNWYFKNGQIDYNYTGLAGIQYSQDSYGFLYFENGICGPGITGLKLCEIPIEGRDPFCMWVYVKDGSWIIDYTGMAQNEYGNWYVKDGGVQTDYTGDVEFEGVTYHIVNGAAV